MDSVGNGANDGSFPCRSMRFDGLEAWRSTPAPPPIAPAAPDVSVLATQSSVAEAMPSAGWRSSYQQPVARTWFIDQLEADAVPAEPSFRCPSSAFVQPVATRQRGRIARCPLPLIGNELSVHEFPVEGRVVVWRGLTGRRHGEPNQGRKHAANRFLKTPFSSAGTGTPLPCLVRSFGLPYA